MNTGETLDYANLFCSFADGNELLVFHARGMSKIFIDDFEQFDEDMQVSLGEEGKTFGLLMVIRSV